MLINMANDAITAINVNKAFTFWAKNMTFFMITTNVGNTTNNHET